MSITLSPNQPSARYLYTGAEVRQLDQRVMASSTPGIVLMKRAGRAALNWLQEACPEIPQISVYAGAGNNAGDGYIVAALAAARNIPVVIIQVGDVAKLTGDAKTAWEFAEQAGVKTQALGAIPAEGVIVDALLGIGVRGEVRGDYRIAIEQINSAALPVMSLDLPSGLCADTGTALGVCVKATITMTFIAYKRGLFTAKGPAAVGVLCCDDLAVPERVFESQTAAVELLSLEEMQVWLPKRALDAHKGHFGHVMVIGGDTGGGGAALMAAEGAARSGAGLVSLATRPEHVSASLTRCPEVMAVGVISGQEVEPWLQRPTVLVVGPGLGQSAWGEQMLQQALNTGLPLVLDADALNLLASKKIALTVAQKAHCILTPHPGEAARLLSCSVGDIQNDRFSAIAKIQAGICGTVILKGAGSLVGSVHSDKLNIISAGNPGMASGGMGDVLSGLVGALLAQGLNAVQAANLGASVHAHAADLAVLAHGQKSLLATDLLPHIGALLDA